MEWSNLNQQMIEQFFQSSNSPSNAQVSLNFTRTSRQIQSNNKLNRQLSHRTQQNQDKEKCYNPQTDVFAYADLQLQKVNIQVIKFDSWFRNVTLDKQKQLEGFNGQLRDIQINHLNQKGPGKNTQRSKQQNKVIQDNILVKFQDLSRNLRQNKSPKCQNCPILRSRVFCLQKHIAEINNQLKQKVCELERLNQIQISNLGQQLQFEVQNRLLSQKLINLSEKNVDLNCRLQSRTRQIIKLNEQIQKFNLQKSTYHFKNKTLQNRLQQMEKSKSLLLSGAKNSTSHTQFNTTNGNTTSLKSSQQQNCIDTSTLIHTNQFCSEKSEPDDYITWFEKIKVLFLQKYKKQQKQYLMKYPGQKGQAQVKQLINNFKKGHVRYEVARSCKTIADYIKKNKQNFFQLLGQQFNLNNKTFLKDKSLFIVQKQGQRYPSSITQQYEQQLKKAQKISSGLQCQISNLNNQLLTLKKTLTKQKQQKNQLSYNHSKLKKQIQQFKLSKNQADNQQNTSGSYYKIELLQQQIEVKSQQIKILSNRVKKFEQSQQKLQLSVKQLEYLLYKGRKQKIKSYKQSISDLKITSVCRIRNKNVQEKHLPSTIHQFQGRVYVQKQKLSYKFDIVEHLNKQPTNDITPSAKKIIQSLFFQSNSSLILSAGSSDSGFKQYMRSEKGLIITSVSQIFKIRQNQKRFVQINVSLQIIQFANSQIYDLMDNDHANRKISIKKDGQKAYLSNCNLVSVQSEKQVRALLLQAMRNQRQQASNMYVTFQFSITDKRSKQKFGSKLVFGQIGLYNQKETNQNIQNLVKDSRSIWNAFNCLNFKQRYPVESNRLTYMLSQCIRQNNKNVLIINVSPTQTHKQASMTSLQFGSSLKMIAQKQPILLNIQRGVERSVTKLRHNSSQNQILPPTSNQGSDQPRPRLISKHRNSSSQHNQNIGQNYEKKKRTISRLSIC